MGCHYHVFVGPYLEVYNPIRQTTVKIRSCGNPACNRHGKHPANSSDQFCPNCGSKIRHIDAPTRGRTEFNIYEAFDKERLTELRFEGMPSEYEDYMLFHSNLSATPGHTFYESTEIMPISGMQPQQDMDTFTSLFFTEIHHIEQVFGKENVKVKWGAIAYWY